MISTSDWKKESKVDEESVKIINKTSIFEIRVSYLYRDIHSSTYTTHTNSIVNYYFLNSHKNNVIKKFPEDIQFRAMYELTGYGAIIIFTNGYIMLWKGNVNNVHHFIHSFCLLFFIFCWVNCMYKYKISSNFYQSENEIIVNRETSKIKFNAFDKMSWFGK